MNLLTKSLIFSIFTVLAVVVFVAIALSLEPHTCRSNNLSSFKVDTISNYERYCQNCHANGIVQAPRFGRYKDWSSRLNFGRDVLAYRALGGIGIMQPKGGAWMLSDQEFIDAANYLISSVPNCE